MSTEIIALQGLTIDVSAVRSEFSADGLPRWTGKVVLTIDEEIVTANWSGRDESNFGTLCDFEGESEEVELYEFCERYADNFALVISAYLGRPSMWDARVVARKRTLGLVQLAS
jgi:hypothetical protein